MRHSTYILCFLLISSCIETDIVEDEIININISPVNVGISNGQVAGLVGSEIQFEAHAQNDRGIIFTPNVTWNSSSQAVATVDNTGLVTLHAKGETMISGEALGTSSKPVLLNVVNGENDIAIIEVEASKTEIATGEGLQLMATAKTITGAENFPDATFTWSSEDETVASVDQNGFLTGVSDGIVIVHAITEGVSGSIMITVGEANARSGSFSGLNGYSVSGNVSLVNSNNEIMLVFEDNFSASNGPGLFIYLSNNASNITGGYEVGPLEKNSGMDTYDLGSAVSLDQYNHVLIWCKPFGVGFGTAQLN